jgi:asparagine synthase (glutamine-hydrolysing)
MCGICGIINFDNRSVELKDLHAMNDQMAHRGPDDDGYYRDSNIGIAMRRLSIIDLEGGQQPLSNEDGSIWIVLNGEIYNYIELRKKLLLKGHKFRTNSDTEVILHLYEDKGFKAVDDLNGMFAFALYDSRKKGLWLVRDRLGIKPLYYLQTKKRFIFASHLKSIRLMEKLKVSSESLLNYLGLAYVPTPMSIYEGVKKLLPGHYLWIERDQISQKKYWQVSEIQTWRGSAKEASAEVERLLTDSVNLRFRSDVPVGILLSGGVDSSALVAMGADSGGEKITTLTINFQEKQGEDTRYANEIATKYSTIHRETNFGIDLFLKEIDELVNILDEPVADTALIPSYRLAKIARQHGIKVLLTGGGGDEIFGGYSRHYKARYGSPKWVAENLSPYSKKIVSQLWTLIQPQRGLRASSPELCFATETSGANLSFLKKVLKEEGSFNKLVKSVSHRFSGLSEDEDDEYGYSYKRMKVDIDNYLVDNVLSIVDKSTMAASVEGRVPLLDHRLVEFAFSLPAGINIANSEPKSIFKRMLNNHLPYELLNRSKEGFNAPVNRWMGESLSDVIRDELIGNPAPLVEQLFRLPLLEKILSAPGQRNMAGNSLYALYIFNKWWHAHEV